MINTILALLLLALAAGGVVVRKTYSYIPLAELKRRALKHDPLASALYEVASYGASLRVVLWGFIVATGAGGLVLFARTAPAYLSFASALVVLALAVAWLPSNSVSRFGTRLTKLVTPVLRWVLNYLYPLLSRIVAPFQKRAVRRLHTGMFERNDLLALIERQQAQDDNRLTTEELAIVKHALTFNDHTVVDVLTSRAHIKTVQADETVGPILINELHETGLDFVLVKDKPDGQVVGSLAVNSLGIKSTGKVSDLMDPTVYFVHENDTLGEALHAFFVTNHPMFVVVNSFEEYVGILTVEHIVKQLLGHVPGDDFDQYSDAAAVAGRHAKPKHAKKSDVGSPEVIE